MKGPDIHRLTAGTVTFQMHLHRPTWSYDDDSAGRLVDVEVEIRALLRLSSAASGNRVTVPTLVGNRHLVERAARRIIDIEGSMFVQPVRVSAKDIAFHLRDCGDEHETSVTPSIPEYSLPVGVR